MSTPSPAHDAEIRVVSCTPSDRAEQARLFNACFKKQVDAAALAWRYDRNPHGASISFLSRVPVGDRGGDGVSGYACSPRRALVRGDETTLAPIGETGDVMTHPEWRKRGLFSALDRACMAEAQRLGWPLAFGLPNRRSAHIFLELGWEQVGTVRPWTFLLRNDEASRSARRREGRFAGWFAARGAAHGSTARARLRSQAGSAYSARELDRFPIEVEQLSREVEKRFELMVRRDAAYLNWRFVESPSRLHRLIGLFDARDRMAAYVVVQLPRTGEAHGFLVDLLARDDAAVAAAVEAGLAALERAGASFVQATAIDGSWWNAQLRGAGFLPPRRDNHLIVILHPNQPDHPLVAAARRTAQWYFTDGDRDDETMG